MRWIRRILLGLTGILAIGYGALVAYAYWPQDPGLPAAQLAGPDDRFAEVDAMSIRYRSWGEQRPGEPVIVLIHGFGNSLQTYRDLAPALADDYRVIALDVPGFGLSSKPADRDYSNMNQGKAITDFIEALGLDNVIIGGHSMGGTLALYVAMQSPHVNGMILLNPGIITTGVPAITEYQFFPLHRLSAKMFGDREFRGSFVRTSFLRPEIITDAVLDDLMLASKTDHYLTGTTQLMKFYESGNEVDMLAYIRVPTLIVWGVEDKNKLDDEAQQLAGMLAESRLALIQNAAHYVHEEKPLESAAAIIAAKDFWATTR